VICGRVTDASLVLGPAAWWHGWAPDSWNELAGAVVAGHIIECGAQAVGGNFAGFTSLPRFLTPGFPIAEIACDGSSVITKHSTDEGAVTVDTVTAQLVYEIQGPRCLNPDVTVHMDTVELEQLGPDRVRVHSVAGSPPLPTTKVSIFAAGGYRIAINTYLTGLDIDAKFELLTAQLDDLTRGTEIDELAISLLGQPVPDPHDQDAATVCVRIAATARTREPLFRLQRSFGALGLSSFPGYMGGDSAGPKPMIEYWPGLLAQQELSHRVVFADGDQQTIAPPAKTEQFTGQPVHQEPAAYESGPDRASTVGTHRIRSQRRQGRKQQRRNLDQRSEGMAVAAVAADHRTPDAVAARGRPRGRGSSRIPAPARRTFRAARTPGPRRLEQPPPRQHRQGRQRIPTRPYGRYYRRATRIALKRRRPNARPTLETDLARSRPSGSPGLRPFGPKSIRAQPK
jgi:hypothetical protein